MHVVRVRDQQKTVPFPFELADQADHRPVGFKDVLPNFVAWIIIQKRGKIKEGYRIEIKEISGRVEHIGYLETEIKTDNDDILYVPNNLFIKSKMTLKNKP